MALASALRFVGRTPQALSFADQALAIAPDHAFARRFRADLLLALGRFREVWPAPEGARADLPRHVVAPKGTTTIDVLAFGRFLAELYPEGVTLMSLADEMVTELLRHVRGVRLVEPSDIPALALQAVPAALGVERDTLAPAERFLDADPVQIERWRKALAGLPRPLIGVDWDQYLPGARVGKVVPLAAGFGTVIGLAVDPERRQSVLHRCS